MILFAADQIAGAEYLLPLLQHWQTSSPRPWRVCGSPRSAAFLQRHDIACEPLTDDIERRIDAMIDETAPDAALFSTSARSGIERALRGALRRRKIPSIQFIDNWTNYALRFGNEQGSLELPDLVLTIDGDAERGMIADGIPATIIHVVGQPYFETRYHAFKAAPVPAGRASRGLLVTQPLAKYFGKQLGFDERDFVGCCLDAWQDADLSWDRLDLVVHPEEDRGTYRALLDRRSSAIAIVENADCDVAGYGAVLGIYSSLLVQAVLAETPTLSVEPAAAGPPTCHLVTRGLIPRVQDVARAAQWLKVTFSGRRQQSRSQVTPLLPAILGSRDRLEHFLLAHSS